MPPPIIDRNDRLRLFFSRKDREFRRCLAPGMSCRCAPIRAHSIQNARILEALARDGNVITPQMRYSATAPPQITLGLEGRSRASTFTGLCADHDNRLFLDLDRGELRLTDQRQLFLLAYRAALRGTHATMRAAAMLQSNYLDGIKRGIFAGSPNDPAGMFALSRMLLSWLAFRYLIRFWEIDAAASFDSCKHIVLTFFECRPSFAVSSMHYWAPTAEIPGANTDLLCSTLTVFPHNGHVVAIISYLAEHEDTVKAHLAPILTSSGGKQRLLLSQLVLRRSENVVLAPSFVDTLSQDRVRAIEAFFLRTLLDPEHVDSDDRLNLFWI
jgi:hypothetical protein